MCWLVPFTGRDGPSPESRSGKNHSTQCPCAFFFLNWSKSKAAGYMWRSKNNLPESIFSFCHIGLGDHPARQLAFIT